jgi:hypothetical protein
MNRIPSPSPPHYSPEFGYHVDLRGPGGKLHPEVGNPLGAAAIGAFQRAGMRDALGR